MKTPSALRLDRDNPYPGLVAFRENDHEYFCGRSREIETLYRQVSRDIITVVFGRSGLGKTSLLNAGLFPRLREARLLPIPIRFLFDPKHPDLLTQVKTAIAREVAEQALDAAPPRDEETLWEYFHRVRFWDRRNKLVIPVLVYDQFEEIFTIGSNNHYLPLLKEELGNLIEDQIPESVAPRHDESFQGEIPFDYEKPGVKVILSLREDYLASLEDLTKKIPSLARNRYRLKALSGESALEAVLRPGKELVSPDVAEKVVRFVAGSAAAGGPAPGEVQRFDQLEVEPALLSLVCRELNNRRQEQGLQTLTEDLLQGSQDRILVDFYQHGVEDLGEGVRRFVEDYLITAHGYRNTMALDNALRLPGVTPDVIDRLVSRRLLRKEERLKQPHVELIHDVLTEAVHISRDQRRREEARRKREQEAEALRRRREEAAAKEPSSDGKRSGTGGSG
jgi:hypothetical protein